MRKTQKLRYIFFGVPLAAVVGVFWFGLTQRKAAVQTVVATDGTALSFLGLTQGSNHWNPKIPAQQRKLYELNSRAGWGWLIGPMLPKTNPISPMMAVTPGQQDVFWFEVKDSLLSLYFAGRMLDENNEEYGSVVNITMDSSMPFFLRKRGIVSIMVSGHADYKRPKAVRIYERDRPFRPAQNAEGPVPDFAHDLYLQNPIGVFRIE